MPDKHYVTIKAAIWKGDKLLIQKEKKIAGDGKGYRSGEVVWDLPGGRVDANEKIHEGLKREIKEELGVDVVSIGDNPVKVWSTIAKSGDNVIALLYEVKLASEDFNFNTIEGEPWGVLEAKYLTAEEFNLVEGEDFTHIPFIKEYFKEQNR